MNDYPIPELTEAEKKEAGVTDEALAADLARARAMAVDGAARAENPGTFLVFSVIQAIYLIHGLTSEMEAQGVIDNVLKGFKMDNKRAEVLMDLFVARLTQVHGPLGRVSVMRGD